MSRVGRGKVTLLGLGLLLLLVGLTVSESSKIDNVNAGDATSVQAPRNVERQRQPTSFVTAVYHPRQFEVELKNTLVEKRRFKRIERNAVPDSEDNIDSRSPNSYELSRTPVRLSSPQSFLGYFDVKTDTIIRTHDSRSLGAEYLNETEKASNNDCLQWCWETPRCNVAVFADKNSGSCYLFDCGPVNSFRCRFTSHGNYKSSVLQVPPSQSSGAERTPYDFAQWKSQVTHENELASLRSRRPSTAVPTLRPTVGTRGEELAAAARYDLATVQPPIPSDIPHSLKQETKDQSHCKHYQFPCRQNEECIAIYNVCDGIPQCPDGSDEAEDLHCPKSNNPLEESVAKSESPVPSPPLPVSPSTSAPYSRVVPAPPNRDKQLLHPSSHLQSNSRPVMNRLLKPNNFDSAEERPRVRGSNLDQDMTTYQKELLDSHLNVPLNRKPSMESNLLENMDKQLEESRVDGGGGNWNPNYPMRDVIRDSEDYTPNNPREGDGESRFVPAQNARTFNSKHSSFVAANAGSYRQPQQAPISNHSPSYSNPQWSSYNDNLEAGSRASSLDVPNQRKNAGLSDLEFSRYDPPLYREGAMTNGGVNIDSVYRHQIETDAAEGGTNYGPYRNNDDRYWPSNDRQMSKYPPKDESQMVPSDVETRVKQSSFLNGYGDGRPSYKGQQREDFKSRHQIPVYPDSVNSGIPHDHGPVVRPLVQNDESPEDAIYEPQAELPPKTTLRPKDYTIKHRTTEDPASITTVKQAEVIRSTIKPAATSKMKQQQHTVHPNPVPGARAVSLISAESGMSIAELKRSGRVHARESNSAVLALSLGLCVTAVLLVLVGCRMRNIRKRLARHGRSSLTHDADYLVNGMYL